jgi:hypothetical protein
MVDVLFPVYTDDFQRALTALLEYVTETELRDRIVTRNYSKRFRMMRLSAVAVATPIGGWRLTPSG